MSKPPVIQLLAALLAFATTSPAADLAFQDDGVAATVTGMGTFTLTWPMLLPGDRKPIDHKHQGRHAELTYAGDAHLAMDLQDGGRVALTFRNLPAGVDRFHTGMLIGPEFGDGGTWRVGDGEAKPFPADKPPKPHLFQGNATAFSFGDVSRHSLALTLPLYSFLQVQDNREWGWKIFQLQSWTPISRDNLTSTIVIGASAAKPDAAAARPLVDRFGQSTRKEFPGRMKDEAELRSDPAAEATWLAGLAPAAVDAWGGMPGSGARLGLKANGFFHVEKQGERWLLVDPAGNACFHLGVCSFGFAPGEDCTFVKDRQAIYEWLPPADGPFAAAWHPEPFWHHDAFSFFVANLIRKHGDAYRKDQVLGLMVDRVRAMGFNAVGAFSGDNPAFAARHFPHVSMTGYHHAALPGIRGIGDPFDDAALKAMDEDWARTLTPHADDPAIVGYFFDNEQAFEDVPKVVPQLKGRHAAKRRLVRLLRETHQDIAAFNSAWNCQAASFESLADQPLAVTTRAASQDMQHYAELFYDAYYQALATTFRRHDRNHLMMGSRWQPGTANCESLCRAAGTYLDIVSINYYTLAIDAGFMRRLHGWTGGKPQVWSEFYYTSGAESSCAASSQDMATQRARGQAYRTYVEGAANLGFVVGIEWFTLIDQAVTGRWFEKLGGERCNTGIFNVCDRPYRDMVEEMATTHRGIYGVWLDGRKPYQIADPRFAAGANAARRLVAGRATGPIVVNGVAANFPGLPPERIGGERLVQGRDAEGFEASLKACWDDANLYLYAQVADPTPLSNVQRGEHLWNGDGIEIFIGGENPDQAGPLIFSDRQILVGAQAAGPCHVVGAAVQPPLKAIAVPTVDGKGYVIEVALPWSALGIKPKAEAELLFDIAVDDAAPGAGRHRQLMWNGIARNSSDRSRWGRLVLMP